MASSLMTDVKLMQGSQEIGVMLASWRCRLARCRASTAHDLARSRATSHHPVRPHTTLRVQRRALCVPDAQLPQLHQLHETTRWRKELRGGASD
jgi:hypothetical protein